MVGLVTEVRIATGTVLKENSMIAAPVICFWLMSILTGSLIASIPIFE
jgi:hypothetical protein